MDVLSEASHNVDGLLRVELVQVGHEVARRHRIPPEHAVVHGYHHRSTDLDSELGGLAIIEVTDGPRARAEEVAAVDRQERHVDAVRSDPLDLPLIWDGIAAV